MVGAVVPPQPARHKTNPRLSVLDWFCVLPAAAAPRPLPLIRVRAAAVLASRRRSMTKRQSETRRTPESNKPEVTAADRLLAIRMQEQRAPWEMTHLSG